MRACVLRDIGNIGIQETATPFPGKGEVRIAVRAAGICGSDIPRIYKTGAHVMPLIPGHEFSGTIDAVGDDVDSALCGRRVGVFPLIPCGNCTPCRKRRFELCRHYDYLGSRRDGGFAEFVTVPAGNTIELPEDVTFEEAAMLEPMAVTVHAMRQAFDPSVLIPVPRAFTEGSFPVQKTGTEIREKKVTVCGLGTIGLLLAMFLRDAGSEELYVIGNKDLQREQALHIGIPADRYCDSRETDAAAWIIEHTGEGTDVFFECVGAPETWSLAAAATAPEGRIVLVGNPRCDMPLSRDIYWKLLRNQLTIRGVWNSSFDHGASDDWSYALERLCAGKVQPTALITHRLSLDELPNGFRILRDRSEPCGKVMMVQDCEYTRAR